MSCSPLWGLQLGSSWNGDYGFPRKCRDHDTHFHALELYHCWALWWEVWQNFCSARISFFTWNRVNLSNLGLLPAFNLQIKATLCVWIGDIKVGQESPKAVVWVWWFPSWVHGKQLVCWHQLLGTGSWCRLGLAGLCSRLHEKA